MSTTRRPSVDHFADNTSQRADYYELDDHRQQDSAAALSRRTSGATTRPPSVGPMNDLGQTPAESMAANFRSTPSTMSKRGSVYGAASPSSRPLSHVREDSEDNTGSIRDSRTIVDSNESLPQKKGVMDSRMGDLEYSDPYLNPTPQTEPKQQSWISRLGLVPHGKYPIEQRIDAKKRGLGVQRHPFVVYALTIIMVGVFIKELVLNAQQQGSPVSFKPVVNPMLGPSESALINIGSRFPPCMKNVSGISPTTQMACMNDTANPPDQVCSIESICGFGGFHDETPNQWFRFITPIFIHAGFVHIILNMLAQLTVSAQVERSMGSIGFLFTYIAAGIFGNVLGGNFSLVGSPSMGASGAIFGTVAITWIDLLAHWKYQYKPVRMLILMTIELLIGIAIGFIPYIDNFAHLGGLLMGLLVGMVFYPVISETRRHKMIVWAFRLAALPVAIVLFVTLTRNFYTSDPYAACSWCRYLSCWPTSSNNHCHGTGFTTYSSTSSSSI